MSSFLARLSVLILLFCLGIFYGVDLASRGIDRVYDPLTPTVTKNTEITEIVPVEPAPNKAGYTEPKVLRQIEPASQVESMGDAAALSDYASTSALNRLANGVGSVVHDLAQALVNLLVSLFERLF